MTCKNCQQELEDGITVCPNCGTDNTPEQGQTVLTETVEETLETEETAEAGESESEEKKPSALRLTLVVAACVVLVAILAALVLRGMGVFGGEEATEPVETYSGTIPTGSGLNDETCKGTYTGTDEEVIAAAQAEVARLGDMVLTNGDLQIYYWMVVSDFVATYQYNSLDVTQPLDRQECEISEGRTWQQYFLTAALNTWQEYAALAQAAEDAGVELSQEDVDALGTIIDSMETQAKTYGYDNALEMLQEAVGAGGDLQKYVDYTELNWKGYAYYQHAYETMTATDAEVSAYFDAHADEYAKEEITRDTKLVDVRHLLLFPEGADINTVFNETFPEEAWETSRLAAEDLLKEFEENGGTEEQFDAMVKEHSQDTTSNENGGLIQGIYAGAMVENFDAWCFDPSRAVGDVGLVETEYGYHIIYYVGEEYIWDDYAKADVLTQKLADHIEATINTRPLEVDYNAIVLGFAKLA